MFGMTVTDNSSDSNAEVCALLFAAAGSLDNTAGTATDQPDLKMMGKDALPVNRRS
jgi:hypothetical protein